MSTRFTRAQLHADSLLEHPLEEGGVTDAWIVGAEDGALGVRQTAHKGEEMSESTMLNGPAGELSPQKFRRRTRMLLGQRVQHSAFRPRLNQAKKGPLTISLQAAFRTDAESHSPSDLRLTARQYPREQVRHGQRELRRKSHTIRFPKEQRELSK